MSEDASIPAEPLEAEKQPAASTPIPVVLPVSSMANPPQSRLLQWWMGLFQKMANTSPAQLAETKPNPFAASYSPESSAKEEAKNRLQLVLMHDRTKLSPTLIESMRDELVEVISKYVEIDKSALDLSLEQESNTIALVANISVVRPRQVDPLGQEAHS